MLIHRETITTSEAPAAIGPYAQVNKVGFGGIYLIFTSGQIPVDPETGEISGNTSGEQTGRVMENLKAVLDAANSGFDRVLKTTIYLKNMDDFAEINEVYGSYFEDYDLPSRSAVEVSRLPKDVLVEIEMIAMS